MRPDDDTLRNALIESVRYKPQQMIIESVNGEARQVFEFSKPDAPAKFFAPVRIGAGYRKQIEIAKAKGMVADGTLERVTAILASAADRPRLSTQEGWIAECQMKAQEALVEGMAAGIQQGNAANADLCVLEVLLTPAPGSMSVKTWYEQFSEESEVQQVLNFSSGLVESKIETAPSETTSGKATKARAKRAAR